MWLPSLILLAFLLFFLAWLRHGQRQRARLNFIDTYLLPPGLVQRVQQRYPALDKRQLELVEAGMRQFFRLSLAARRRPVAMPSQVVDELWHNFILYTRNYQQFCQRAFGFFLHHTPAVAMGGAAGQRAAIRRAWHLACREEGINPANPARLPLLFELDRMLAIPGGFIYQPDCRAPDCAAGSYCGAELGSDSGCASCSSGGGNDAGGGDSGGDGGGDGGGGCGGGGD